MATIKETSSYKTKDKHNQKSPAELTLKDNSKLKPESVLSSYESRAKQRKDRHPSTGTIPKDSSRTTVKDNMSKYKRMKDRGIRKDKTEAGPKNDFNHNNISTNMNDVIVQYDDEDQKFKGTIRPRNTQTKTQNQQSHEIAEITKQDLDNKKNSAVDSLSDENDELSKVVWKDTSPRLTPKTLESLNEEPLSDAVDGNSKYVDLWLDIMREYVCLWKDIEDRELSDMTDVPEHETPTPIMSQNSENTEHNNSEHNTTPKVKNICTSASNRGLIENQEEKGITFTDLGEITTETPECYDNWDINDFTLIPEDSDDANTANNVKIEQLNGSPTGPNYQKEIPFVVNPQNNERTKLITKDINGVYNPQKTLHEKLHKSYVAKTCVDRAKKLHRENMMDQQKGNNDVQNSELSNSPQSDIDSVYAWTLNGTEFASDNEYTHQQGPKKKIPAINEEEIIYESAINNCYTPSQQKPPKRHLTKKLRKKQTFSGQTFTKSQGNLKQNKATSKLYSGSDPSKVDSQNSQPIHKQPTHVRSQSEQIQRHQTDDYHGNKKPEHSTRRQHQNPTGSKHYISESEATVYEFDRVIQQRSKHENKHFITSLKNPVLLNGGGKYYIMVPRPIETLNFDSDDSESVHSYDSQCEACNIGSHETFSETESTDSFDSQCEACIEKHKSSLGCMPHAEQHQKFLPNQQNLRSILPDEPQCSRQTRMPQGSMGSTSRSQIPQEMSQDSTRSMTLTPRSYHQQGRPDYMASTIVDCNNQRGLYSARPSSPGSRASVSASQQSEIESDYGTESEHTVAYAIGPIHSIRSAHVDFHNDCDSGISSVSLNSSKSKHSSSANIQSMLWESLNGGIKNKLKLRNSAYLTQPNGSVEYKVSRKFLNHYTCEIKPANDGHLRVTKV